MANSGYLLTYLCNTCNKYVTLNHLHKFPISAQVSEVTLVDKLTIIPKDKDGCYVID